MVGRDIFQMSFGYLESYFLIISRQVRKKGVGSRSEVTPKILLYILFSIEKRQLSLKKMFLSVLIARECFLIENTFNVF